MRKDMPGKLSPNTLVLHWLVGITFIGLLAIGLYMAENEAFALYPWHKSFGVLIALFVVLRIAWRIANGWPAPVGDHSRFERVLARLIHHLLLLGTLVMPVSGFMMSALGGHGVAFFGLELVPPNPDPFNPQEVVAINASVASVAHEVHEYAGFVLILAVVLHVLGALKHHVVDHDGTLRRMLGAKI